jgi:thiamine-monophosphate kinase
MPAGREDSTTAWLRRRLAHAQDLLGDDAAFLPDGNTAVTLDQQIAGIHFPDSLGPDVVGRRLVAVNLSDIAAVGGVPAYAFLGVGAPHDYPLRRLLAAVERSLSEQGAVLAGGDMARSPSLTASLTLIGHRHPHGRWVRRSEARPGDRLWIGGTLGESALGRALLEKGECDPSGRVELPDTVVARRALAASARRAVRRHFRPPDQLATGAWLSRRRRAAAIDVSDGLLLDLERLCQASGVGALIDATKLPTSAHFAEIAARIDAEPSDLALSGGEDYVLLFAVPPGVEPPTALDATRIGEVTQGRGITIEGATPPVRKGWDHFATKGETRHVDI